MHKEKIEILERALKREKAARKQAEKILEDKSRDLYLLSDKLKNTNEQLENLLQEKSSQLQGVFENINDAYLIIDLDGNVINMNNVAIDLFGYDIEKENLNVAQLIYVKDIEYAYNSFNTLIELGIFSNYIARIYTKKKLVRWVQINATIIFDTDKKIMCFS